MQNVKKANPGIPFTEIGKVLGERWNKMTGMNKYAFCIQFVVNDNSANVNAGCN